MTDLKLIRSRVLDLHKALIVAEKLAYESRHGRVSPHQFWQVLTSDPSLAWLAPLNAGILRLDELLDARARGPAPATTELDEHMAMLKALLELDERDDAFAARYAALVHAEPDVTYAHAALQSAWAKA